MTGVSLQSERMIAARLERLPISAWHIKVSTVLGIAIFFDAFDSIALAFVLPVLAGAWNIAPQQIGSLIAIGNAGQAIGALGCGVIAERFGRVKTAQWTIVLFAAMSLACAFAQNFDSLNDRRREHVQIRGHELRSNACRSQAAAIQQN